MGNVIINASDEDESRSFIGAEFNAKIADLLFARRSVNKKKRHSILLQFKGMDNEIMIDYESESARDQDFSALSKAME